MFTIYITKIIHLHIIYWPHLLLVLLLSMLKVVVSHFVDGILFETDSSMKAGLPLTQ